MGGFLGSLFQWIQQFKPWFTVYPWEQSLRIRMGKRLTRCGPGIHFRIPFIDNFCIQNTRLLVTDLPNQTMTTRDGRVCSLSGVVGWRVTDILTFYESMQHPDRAVAGVAMAKIAEIVSTAESAALTPATIQAAVLASLKANEWGVAFAMVQITDMAFVRTYRLISDVPGGGQWRVSSGNAYPDVREY